MMMMMMLTAMLLNNELLQPSLLPRDAMHSAAYAVVRCSSVCHVLVLY